MENINLYIDHITQAESGDTINLSSHPIKSRRMPRSGGERERAHSSPRRQVYIHPLRHIFAMSTPNPWTDDSSNPVSFGHRLSSNFRIFNVLIPWTSGTLVTGYHHAPRRIIAVRHMAAVTQCMSTPFAFTKLGITTHRHTGDAHTGLICSPRTQLPHPSAIYTR